MTSSEPQLGKYRLLGELGQGGFAVVYRALDTTLEREVALKVLRPALLADEQFVERFVREAKLIASLRHPNIITIYEVEQQQGRLYIAMELAEHGGLDAQIARRGRFAWSEAVAILEPVAAALDYAHSRGIVHRDLKPGNILLGDGERPILTDFGFARLFGESRVSMTLAGGVVGTPEYIAPEIWEHNAASPASDLYALGCVAYELLTGEQLFAGPTPLQVLNAHNRGPRFPEQWPSGIPAGAQTVLQQAVAREPGARFKTGAAFVEALKQLQHAAPPKRPEHAPAAAHPPPAPMPAPAPAQEPQAAPAATPALQESPAVTKAMPVPAQEPQASPGATPASQRVPPTPARASWLSFLPWVAGVVGVGIVVMALLDLFGVNVRPRPPAPTAAPAPEATDAPMPTEAAVPTVARAPTTAMLTPDQIPELVEVPAGPFLMGSSDADTLAQDDEKPQHTLELPAYWIGKTEVTNAQFRPFVEGDGYTNRAYWTEAGWAWKEEQERTQPYYEFWDHSNWNGDDQPVVGVTWYEAVAYVRWLSDQTGHEFRLPTEAEWEKAARGSDGWIWPWGSEWIEGRANTREAGLVATTPVGQYAEGASPYGALDMAGNAKEWCATMYKDYPYTIEDEWTVAYLEGNVRRIIRDGGSFWEKSSARGAFRYSNPASSNGPNNDGGLRVASYSPYPEGHVKVLAEGPHPPSPSP